jgi:hypothetical protein
VISLEGANCAGLPAFVIDKYFDCDAGREPLKAMVAMAICHRCLVIEECRTLALNQPDLQPRGVIGGVTAHEIRRARAWRQYEQGVTDQVPPVSRPEWLARAEASETAEQGRLEVDPDEPRTAR